MAIVLPEYEPKTHRKEWQSGFKTFKQRAYSVGQEGTLVALDLEEGDNLPEDSTYEIVSSKIEYTKDGARIAVVTAFAERTV